MFEKKEQIWFVILLMALLYGVGCSKPSLSKKVPSRDAALEHFKSKDVSIIPDDNGQVLSLVLDNAKIVDADLHYTNSFPELEYISLNETSISDNGLKQLATLTKLEKLYLRKTNISDEGLLHLKQMQQLIILDLSATQVTAQGIIQLQSLSNLDHVLISETSISKEDVVQLKQAIPECQFSR